MNGSAGAQTTVVIATRNRREQLLRTLRNLQWVSGDPPVVLVDNASTDGTPDAVAAAFPRVRVLRARCNLGAVARNVGVHAARTPLVAFSDDDSWWGSGALDRAARHFAAAPGVALLAARTLIGIEEGEDPVCAQMARSPLPRAPGAPGPAILGFVACGAIVRRDAFLAAGGFSPVLFFLGEEDVLAHDLAAAGWSLAYVADVIAHHHPQAGPERGGRRRLQARNALLSAWMRRPLVVAVRATIALAVTPSADARGAVFDALCRLPAALAARRVLPAAVEAQLRLLANA